ncbi:MAG: flagellin FliC [Methylococcaceae bacterium]|nr:flagellin FliC [Methylococcaceae bacterium]
MSSSFVINTNMASINGQRMLGKTTSALSTSMERLSSGLRVNSSKDDAAGLAIGTRMTTQIRGMTVAMRNANDGISMAQTTEGAISELTDIMQRMRELTVQAANTGAVSSQDRQKLQDEFKQMGNELHRVIQNTSYNGNKVLAGGASNKNFQVGWSAAADNHISITISTMSGAGAAGGISKLFGAAGGLSIGSGVSATSKFGSVLNIIDKALDSVNNTRAKLGAIQNRFMSAISNLSQSIENNSAARSRIMDADFAVETANLSRGQILQQAGTAMLAQANQSTQAVMKLLQ